MRQVLVYQGESGLWVAEVPSLPGCVSQGQTREEAILNVREAIGLHTEALLANRQEIPPDRLRQVYRIAKGSRPVPRLTIRADRRQ